MAKKQTLTLAKNGEVYEIKDKTLGLSALRALVNTITEQNAPKGVPYLGKTDVGGIFQLTKDGGESEIIAVWNDPAAYEDTTPVTWGATVTQVGLNLDILDKYFNGEYDFVNKVYKVPANSGATITAFLVVLRDSFNRRMGIIALNVSLKAGDAPQIANDGLIGFPLAMTFLTDDLGSPFYVCGDMFDPAEAKATAEIGVDEDIDTITVTDGGERYTVAPTVTIIGDGAGATAHAVLVDDYVDAIIVDTPGAGYSVATVQITRVLDEA